jgi:hypothetical protein
MGFASGECRAGKTRDTLFLAVFLCPDVLLVEQGCDPSLTFTDSCLFNDKFKLLV